MNDTDVCQIRVRSDPWSPSRMCGRKVKADGLCGLHLGVKSRRATREAEYQAAQQTANRVRAEAEELSRVLGIRVDAFYDPHYYGGGRYSDEVFVVPAKWLRQLAERQGG